MVTTRGQSCAAEFPLLSPPMLWSLTATMASDCGGWGRNGYGGGGFKIGGRNWPCLETGRSVVLCDGMPTLPHRSIKTFTKSLVKRI